MNDVVCFVNVFFINSYELINGKRLCRQLNAFGKLHSKKFFGLYFIFLFVLLLTLSLITKFISWQLEVIIFIRKRFNLYSNDHSAANQHKNKVVYNLLVQNQKNEWLSSSNFTFSSLSSYKFTIQKLIQVSRARLFKRHWENYQKI